MIKVLQKKLPLKLFYIYAFQFSIICFETLFAVFSYHFILLLFF